jgi:4-hydroxy-tetrahydrodipicolinate reductase
MSESKPAIWIHGASGRMGQEIQKALAERGRPFRLIGGSGYKFEGADFQPDEDVTASALAEALDKYAVELIVDFSAPEANVLLLDAMRTSHRRGMAVLLGTTGLTPEQLTRWRDVASAGAHRILVAPNTSIGILLLAKAALLAAGVAAGLAFDVEIVETHHRAKKDAPSGTAKFLAETIAGGVDDLAPQYDRRGARRAGEIGVHAVRGGGVYGEHEVRIIGDSEEICLSHRAFSRSLFAAGALTLGTWLLTRNPGYYNLLDIDVKDLR